MGKNKNGAKNRGGNETPMAQTMAINDKSGDSSRNSKSGAPNPGAQSVKQAKDWVDSNKK